MAIGFLRREYRSELLGAPRRGNDIPGPPELRRAWYVAVVFLGQTYQGRCLVVLASDASLSPALIRMAEDTAPIVRIRELKKDSVNFVLENVDLAFANSVRRVMMADLPTVG
jgi:hypothetical protein